MPSETFPIEVFFSYAHKDKRLRDELAKHLELLERQGVITGWHDQKIMPGQEWDAEIKAHLNSAAIILLLFSPDFLASKYSWGVEVDAALARHAAGSARVIPVILRPCDWQNTKFRELQALPTDGKPVTIWSNRDEAFLDVARGIREAVKGPPPPPLPPPERPAADTSVVPQVLAEVHPSWLGIARDVQLEEIEAFVDKGARGSVWIWGDPGCGSSEFLQLTRRLLWLKSIDVIYFDALDVASGVTVDQQYFLGKLEVWADDYQVLPQAQAISLNDRVAAVTQRAAEQLRKRQRRLALLFANYHQLLPAMQKWTWQTFWNQLLSPLDNGQAFAVFAYEGVGIPEMVVPAPNFKISLQGFIEKRIEQFLRERTDLAPAEVRHIAEMIYTESTQGENAQGVLASPKRVYQSLLKHWIQGTLKRIEI